MLLIKQSYKEKGHVYHRNFFDNKMKKSRYRTDVNGDIIAESDGKTVKITTKKP